MNQKKTKNKPAAKRMMLFCEPCGHKRIIEVEELAFDQIDPNKPGPKLVAQTPSVKGMEAVEVKTSPIQLKAPTLDPITHKTVESKFQPQPKKYKCPCCGRATKLRELLKPYSDILVVKDEQARKAKEEEEKKKRLEDGKPPEKKIDPDFIG
jgi:DNA-directed RNA polymerase subunit RPC12/RpoP